MNQAASSSAHTTIQQITTVPFWYDTVKRILDIIVSLTVLVVFFPLWLLIAIAIKITSRGPILYVADTVGKDGKLFRLYKFRTMRADVDEDPHREYLARLVNGDEHYTTLRRQDGSEQKIYKIVNDSRVTALGRTLRATGLDEAPQLLNVLRGEMSMVGPRPPRPTEYEHYQEWHKQRLSVIPGISGLYEVTARAVVPFDEMVRIDLEYIRRRSLWLDLKILLLTPINVILLRKGGY
jgi:lipopolysaccharide/colanic/teichoic acid biosynthesis glycosyltransferase